MKNRNTKKRLLQLALVLTLGLTLLPAKGQAIELGLTPSHVYSLWTNINNALLATGPALSKDADFANDLKAMKASAWKGKKPGEVLKQVVQFRNNLDRLRAKSKLKATPVYKDPKGGDVTPSVVFVNSGHVLDSLVLLLNSHAPDHLISGFYVRHDISGKKPSDAYSMVELANRRLNAIVAKTGG